MAQNWRILYYESRKGHCPVQEFISTQKTRQRAKIMNWIELLESEGPQLPRPYADLLEDGIHELRIKISGDQIRILYFFCFRHFIVLTHTFPKHTERVAPSEIAYAQKCRADFMARYDEETLKERLDEDI